MSFKSEYRRPFMHYEYTRTKYNPHYYYVIFITYNTRLIYIFFTIYHVWKITPFKPFDKSL